MGAMSREVFFAGYSESDRRRSHVRQDRRPRLMVGIQRPARPNAFFDCHIVHEPNALVTNLSPWAGVHFLNLDTQLAAKGACKRDLIGRFSAGISAGYLCVVGSALST